VGADACSVDDLADATSGAHGDGGKHSTSSDSHRWVGPLLLHTPTTEVAMSTLTIIIIVVVVLLVLGVFGRGRL
jgi:hypothetical protein